MNTNKDQVPQSDKTDFSKSVYNYEIEKLDSGYLVTKNEKVRVGISNADNLENEMKNVLSYNANLKEYLCFMKNTKVKITISVEVIP